jgi:putative protein-disulfide isomerase
MQNTSTLIYVHDPMCSWCWGFSPTLKALRQQLPPKIRFQRLVGGLAPDSNEPMPIEIQHKLQNIWRTIQEKIPGTEFNFDFWEVCQPRRSTYPACRAVLSARAMQPALEEDMISAIQTAYYTRAMNPSNADTLRQLAQEIGLDPQQFSKQLHSETIEQALQQDLRQARQMGANSFPSLVLKTPGYSYWPINVHYTDAGSILSNIENIIKGIT